MRVVTSTHFVRPRDISPTVKLPWVDYVHNYIIKFSNWNYKKLQPGGRPFRVAIV